jgi:predicted nucleic acid-binding protein
MATHAPSRIQAMITKERLHKLVDGLSEAEADATLEFVVSRGHGEGASRPRCFRCPPRRRPCRSGVPLPTGWPDWTRCAAGADARRRRERRCRGVRQGERFAELGDELGCPVQRIDPRELGKRMGARRAPGWGRTYDAEYVALAQILGCRVVTIDARLRRGAAQLGIVIGLDELIQENAAKTAPSEPEAAS